MRRLVLFGVAVLALATFGITACSAPAPVQGVDTTHGRGSSADTTHAVPRPPQKVV